MTTISSSTNPAVKHLKKLLSSSRYRRKSKQFVVEGEKEVSSALDAGYELLELYTCEEYSPSLSISCIERRLTTALIASLAYRNTTKVIGVFRSKLRCWEDVVLDDASTLLICDGVEKPGNLGAMLRTCDAVGAKAFVVSSDSDVDVFNPNIIRSSVGCIFQVPIIVATQQEIYDYCQDNQIATYALNPGQKTYLEVDYPKKVAFVMGAEHDGISPFWIEQADEQIAIPMLGYNDSLNVSVSAAIVVYERYRRTTRI